MSNWTRNQKIALWVPIIVAIIGWLTHLEKEIITLKARYADFGSLTSESADIGKLKTKSAEIGISPTNKGLLVTTNGNVGIGTTAPVAIFQIIGSGSGTGINLDANSLPKSALHIKGANTSIGQGLYCEGCLGSYKIGTTCWQFQLNVISGNTATLNAVQVTCP
jgi:hypothetical protein